MIYKDQRYAIPRDSEVRLFFVHNGILRAAGMSADFIAALPGQVEAGEFTMYDCCDLAA